jgi:hypothetical protein
MSDPALIRDPIIEAAAQIKAALEEIDNLIGMIECSNKHNLALLPLFLAEQKRALAALARMEQPDMINDKKAVRTALEIIAGKRQCLDNLMGNKELAELALAALTRMEQP